MELIYLDHNGSAPVAPEVVEAMRPWFGGAPGNPASAHAYGRKGKEAIERSRAQLAALLGSSPAEIIFTSGGTESNNLALKGVAESKGFGRVLTVATEHPSVLHTCRYLERRGFGLDVCPVDGEGKVSVSAIERLIKPDTILISVMLANNEVGTILPVPEIAALARARGILVHCDAAQVVGKEPVNVEALNVDLLTVAGHKLNAPKGVGALYVREGTELAPQQHGSGHERGLRSGTQDVLEIVGLGAAAQRFVDRGEQITAEYRRLRGVFEDELFAALPEAVLNGPRAERLVNTSNVSFVGVSSGELLGACPGIACAPGAACHKDHTTPSHVLTAMGLPAERIESSIRFSLGFGTTEQELKNAVELLRTAYHQQLTRKPTRT